MRIKKSAVGGGSSRFGTFVKCSFNLSTDLAIFARPCKRELALGVSSSKQHEDILRVRFLPFVPETLPLEKLQHVWIGGDFFTCNVHRRGAVTIDYPQICASVNQKLEPVQCLLLSGIM